MIDVDRYHREVGRIYLGDRFINMEMVRDGFAWRYVRYDKPGEFTAADAQGPRREAWPLEGLKSGCALGLAAAETSRTRSSDALPETEERPRSTSIVRAPSEVSCRDLRLLVLNVVSVEMNYTQLTLLVGRINARDEC